MTEGPRWSWAQPPGNAIDFERTETGFDVQLQQVRSVWQSLRVWRSGPMSLVMALPGAIVGGAAWVGLVGALGLTDLMPVAGLWILVGGQIARSILHPVVLPSRVVVERDRVEVQHDGRVVWQTTLDRLAVDVDYDTLVLIGTDSTLRMRCRERTEDLEFLAEQLRQASDQHGTAHDVPESMGRVRGAETER